jgi:hypothetical protein
MLSLCFAPFAPVSTAAASFLALRRRCLTEIHAARVSGVPVVMVVGMRGRRLEFVPDRRMLCKLLFLVDLLQSECREVSDREQFLLAPVRQSDGGVPALNAHIRGAVVGAIGASATPKLARAACGDAAMLRSFGSAAPAEKQALLVSAAFGGWAAVVRALLESGAKPIHIANCGLSVSEAHFDLTMQAFSPLAAAAAGGHLEVCKMLVHAKADVNEAPPTGSRNTELHPVAPLIAAAQVRVCHGGIGPIVYDRSAEP